MEVNRISYFVAYRVDKNLSSFVFPLAAFEFLLFGILIFKSQSGACTCAGVEGASNKQVFLRVTN